MFKSTSSCSRLSGWTLLLSLMLSGSLLQAQGQKADPRFRGYPVVGFNISQIDGDLLAGFHKPGLQAGAGVYAFLDQQSRMSLSMEILFNQKGSRTRPGSFPVYKFLLNYVDLPVQFNYHDKDRMIFSGGFSYGRLFGATDSLKLDDSTTSVFAPREFGYLVTATFLVKENIGIGLRYSGSLATFGEAINPKVKGLTNRAITIRGSYIF
jgi:hypothetical protein